MLLLLSADSDFIFGNNAPCQLLWLNFKNKSDFFNYDFSIKLSAIIRFDNELDFGAKKAQAARYIMAGSCSFQNVHYKNAANDCYCLFPAVGCTIFCI